MRGVLRRFGLLRPGASNRGAADLEGAMRGLLAGLFLLCALAVSPLIAPWLWGLLAMVGVWGGLHHRFASLRRPWPLFMAAALGSYVAGVLLLGSHWFSAESVTGFVLVVTALKLIEVRRKVESLWLLAACIVLAGIGTLYWSSLAGLAYVLLLMAGLVYAMVLLARPGSSHWRGGLTLAGRLFAYTLPLALILFFTFPRISGPLWDLGLAFGMPLTLTATAPPEPPLEGNRLRGDKVGSFLTQANTVLVAEFEGKVPYKSELYWRGPVFYHFDGLEWFLEEGGLRRAALMQGKYDSATAWARDVQPAAGEGLSYRVRVMPHGQRWLYALDLSTGGAPETFVSRELQLLSIRELHQEFSYRSTAYLDYRATPPLDEATRKAALDYPPGNPRLKALGAELALDYLEPEQRIHQVYKVLRSRFAKSDEPAGEGSDALDRLWFERRAGNMLDTASAVALLLRASGVPVRLVSGYRGGTLVALTDFVMVKQSNTHIWLEAWLGEKGWVRVEPQDFIGVQRAAPAPSAVAAAAAAQQENSPQQARHEHNERKPAAPDAAPAVVRTGEAGSGSTPLSPSGAAGGWASLFDEWMIRYDPGKQSELFSAVGNVDISALRLIVMSLAAVITLGLFYLALLGLGARARPDRARQAYRRLQAALRRHIEPRAAECPSAYLQRLHEAAPEVAQAAAPLIEQYLQLRYGAVGGAEVEKSFVINIKRLLAALSV